MVTSLSNISNAKFVITKLEQGDNATMQYSFSTKVSINCDMNFAKFPFDTQTCPFRIRSLKKDPIIIWSNITAKTEPLKDSEFWVRFEETSNTKINNMTVVGFDLQIKRKSQSFLYEFFIPCLLMVVTSWVSFAVKPEAVPGRLGMLLTLFLMLVNMISSVSQNIPKSDTVCLLVTWILISIVFVFAALLEYFVILLSVKFRGTTRRVSGKIMDIEEKDKLEDWAKKLDMWSLAIFPALYFVVTLTFILYVQEL